MIEAIPGAGALAGSLEDLGARAFELAQVVRHWYELRGLSAIEYADGPLAGEAARRFLAAQEVMTKALAAMQGGG